MVKRTRLIRSDIEFNNLLDKVFPGFSRSNQTRLAKPLLLRKMEEMARDKRGSVQDVVVIGGILLAFSFIILMMFAITDRINDRIQVMPVFDSLSGGDEARNTFSKVNNLFPGVIDNSFLLLTIGLAISAIILSFLVRVHPVFIIFYFIVLTIMIFITGAFSNVYQKMAENPQLAIQAQELVFTSYIMTYMPFIVGTIGIIISVIMFKNWQSAQ